MNFKLFLSNCTVAETPPIAVTDNERITFTVTVNQGCILNTNYDVGVSNARYTGSTQRINSTTATLNFIIDSDNPSDNTLTAIIALNAQSSTQYDEFMIIFTGTFTNCTTNIASGDIIYTTQSFEITANKNCNFLNSVYYIGALDAPIASYDKIQLNINSSSDKLFITANDITADETVLWAYAEYIATQSISIFDGFINLFNPSKEDLTNLSRTMVINLSTGQPYTYMQFILDLFSIPFSLQDLQGTVDSVVLGNFDTSINCTRLNNEILVVPLGDITVTGIYNNIYDYLDTEVFYNAPFFGAISIDTNYAIGHTISGNFEINLLNGDCVINLISTYTNEIFYSSMINIGKHIPLLDRANNTLINNLTMSPSQYLYNHAFITVTRNIPYAAITEFGHGVTEYKALSECAGYIEINDINLASQATDSEKAEIINLLKSGIFINNDTA